MPDYWLAKGNPWEIERLDVSYPVRFGGSLTKQGSNPGVGTWEGGEVVKAIAYDTPVPGFNTYNTNRLRLWRSRPGNEFDLQKFNDGIYDKTIKLNPEFSKMLMLKDSYGNIKCNHCAGGIIGYRTNQFTKKNTFVFMANSNDFYDSKPADKDQSMLQLMKMDYADTSKNGPRIVVVKNDDDDDDDDDESSSNDDDDEEEEDNDGGDAEDHCVHLNNTVQQNLNQIERAFRQFLLKYYGCELFPHYCSMLDKSQSKPSLLGNGTSNLRIKGG